MRLFVLLGSAGVCAVAAPALAQSDDIVVTAQKRSERLIDTPQSVTALSAADLEKLNATQFADFAATVPGLQFTTKGAGDTSISLRGVTTGNDIAPTVGIYVDDVPYGSSTTFGNAAQLALDVGLFDLDRIEVLRGPQGTLYGASSMGGVLKYVTRAPSLDQAGGTVQGGVSGTDGGGANYTGSAEINIPIVTDKIAVRASGFYARDGGFENNVATGEKDVNRSSVYGGRIDVLMKPVDDLTIRLTGFGQNIRRDGSQYVDYTLAGAPLDGDLNQDHPLSEPFRADFRLVSGTVAYDFGFATLTSITSYQTSQSDFTLDASAVYVPVLDSVGLPVTAASTSNDYRTKKFTEELRLTSAQGKPVEWLLGAFYTHESTSAHQVINSYGTGLVPLAIDLADALVPSMYKEYAVFGDVTWHLTDRFDLTGGLRYAHNDQNFAQVSSGLLAASEPTQYAGDGVVTYLANARYRVGRDFTAYARFATGYRPGGPNYLALDATTGQRLAPATFQSDSLKSYEIGVKAETPDHRFAIDASTYFIDWDNIQLLTAVDGFSAILNAGGAHVKGAETTLTARPVKGLTMVGAFAWNDAYLTADDSALGGVKGERLPNSAHFTMTLNADYVVSQQPLRPTLGATLRYVGDRTASFDGSTGTPQYTLPAYTSTDIRAGVTLGRVDAQIFVHNLFDVRGQLSAYTLLSSYGGPAEVALIQPRTIGVNAAVHF